MLPLEQLHPIAVHFPIVFMLTLAALDVIIVMRGYEISGNGTAAISSAGLAALAASGALVAFYLGDAALDIAVATKAPAAPLEIHENLGTLTAWAIVVLGALRGLAWWKQIPITGNRRLLVVGVEIVLAGMIIATAYFGGALVFDYGVAVNPTGG